MRSYSFFNFFLLLLITSYAHSSSGEKSQQQLDPKISASPKKTIELEDDQDEHDDSRVSEMIVTPDSGMDKAQVLSALPRFLVEPNIEINLQVPEDAIDINMSKSPLIWATVIISSITLVLSGITFVDKIRKDKKATQKSLLDDFWYRTVIHPECTSIINGLYTGLLCQLRGDKFGQKQHEKCFSTIHISLCRLDQLSILPYGKTTFLRISEIMQGLEEEITAFWLFKDNQMSDIELAKSGTPVPELLKDKDFDGYSVKFKIALLNELLSFHTKLSVDLDES